MQMKLSTARNSQHTLKMSEQASHRPTKTEMLMRDIPFVNKAIKIDQIDKLSF